MENNIDILAEIKEMDGEEKEHIDKLIREASRVIMTALIDKYAEDHEKDFEMIHEMIEMQETLDKSFIVSRGVEPTMLQRKMALLDELGEVTHELKGDWCWWKKTQAPVDNERVLAELVDVWHFALGIQAVTDKEFEDLPDYMGAIDLFIKNHEDDMDYKKFLENNNLVENTETVLPNTIALTYILGFTIEDVYKGYKEKNAENYRRIKDGY